MGLLKRFVVAEDSMRPRLEPGDGVLAVRTSRARRGQIRCFEHPERPGFWLVKRVDEVHCGQFAARSDNEVGNAVDSRHFGDVAIAGSYRVVVVIPKRFMR